MATKAQIIADTVSSCNVRITTFQVEAPRFLLAEVNTHRVIARSAASSRAIPVRKRNEMVRNDPFVPHAFGKNKRGMQADENLDEASTEFARKVWYNAIADALYRSEQLDAIGTHKQIANRLLEPFTYYSGVMTATEWDNFWHLRIHPDAQPEFDELARAMKTVYDISVPKRSQHHLPYTDDCPLSMSLSDRFMVSAARCARVSYKSLQTGASSDPAEDIELCDKLITSGHLSPFDHPALADSARSDGADLYWEKPSEHKHLYGWIPYRTEIEQRLGRTCRRDSHAPIEAPDLYFGSVDEGGIR